MPNPPSAPPQHRGGLMSGNKKWWVIGGGAVGLIMIWEYRKQAGAQQQSSANTASTQASDLAAQGIDPATGIPYSQEYGGGSYGGSYGAVGGYGGYGIDPTTGIPYAQEYAGYGTTTTPSTPPAQTNQGWVAAVEQALSGQGYSIGAVSGALGAYLLGLPLTQDQLAIVEAATGTAGPAPNAPKVTTIPPTGQNTSGGTTTQQKVAHQTATFTGTAAALAKAWGVPVTSLLTNAGPIKTGTQTITHGTHVWAF